MATARGSIAATFFAALLIQWIFKLRPRRFAIAFVVGVSIFTATFLGLLFQRMAPVRTGTPNGFWKCLSGIDLDQTAVDVGGRAYFVNDDWLAYENLHWHGSTLYCVPTKTVMPQFETVINLLKQQQECGSDSFAVCG